MHSQSPFSSHGKVSENVTRQALILSNIPLYPPPVVKQKLSKKLVSVRKHREKRYCEGIVPRIL